MGPALSLNGTCVSGTIPSLSSLSHSQLHSFMAMPSESLRMLSLWSHHCSKLLLHRVGALCSWVTILSSQCRIQNSSECPSSCTLPWASATGVARGAEVHVVQKTLLAQLSSESRPPWSTYKNGFDISTSRVIYAYFLLFILVRKEQLNYVRFFPSWRNDWQAEIWPCCPRATG